MIEFARTRKGTGPGNLKIKSWKPHHTAIVMDRVAGATVTELADKYVLSEAMITAIATSRQGKILIANIEQRVLEQKFADLPETRKQGIIKAQQRILDFLADDELQQRAPLACAPVNLKAFESLTNADRHITAVPGSSVTYNTQVNILGSEVKRDALAAGLQRALLAEEMHKMITGESIDIEGAKVSLLK